MEGIKQEGFLNIKQDKETHVYIKQETQDEEESGEDKKSEFIAIKTENLVNCVLGEEEEMSNVDQNPWSENIYMNFGEIGQKSVNFTDADIKQTDGEFLGSEEFCNCAVSFAEPRSTLLQSTESIGEKNIEDFLRYNAGEVKNISKNRITDSMVKSCINDALKVFYSNSNIEGESSAQDVWNRAHCAHCKKKIKHNHGKHFMSETCGNEFKCPICNGKFNDALNFYLHSFQHSQNSTNEKNVPRRLPNGTSKEKYRCEICLKEFNQKGNFNKHVLIHTGEKRFKCDVCNKSFYRKQKLADHLPFHTNERRHECKLCNKLFIRKWDLTRHMLRHEGKVQFTCQICFKSFSCKKGLFDHSACHTNEKSHVCATCTRSFTCKKYLSRHSQIHTREIRLVCIICNKSFVNKGILARHVIVHENERNYICEKCNKAFIRKSDLDRHKLIHAEQKPFHCQLCNKRFSSKSYLNQHQVHHSHGKVPNCERCGKHFTRKAYLQHVVSCINSADTDSVN